MKKCNAKIRKKNGTQSRCNVETIDGERLCPGHFDQLGAGGKKEIQSRSLALRDLIEIGIAIHVIAGIAESLERIYRVVEPFLSFAEKRHFETLLTNSDRYERWRAAKLLKDSLTRNPVISFPAK